MKKTKFSGRKTNLCPNQKNPASGGILIFLSGYVQKFFSEKASAGW
jgi:hypothetical protein